MTSMRTVVVAVSYGTVVIDKGRRALARPKPITNTVRLAKGPVLPVRGKGAWYARNVHLILVMISMVITSLAAVLADLFIRVLVDVTKITRTGNIGTVRSIITAVALAEAVGAVSLIITVVRAVVDA